MYFFPQLIPISTVVQGEGQCGDEHCSQLSVSHRVGSVTDPAPESTESSSREDTASAAVWWQ